MARKTVFASTLLALMLVVPGWSHAESIAVQIRLSGDTGKTQYIVPTGKVLLVEHIEFCDYWVSQPELLEVWVAHNTNPSGSVWSSNIAYFSAHNYLPRPLRLPAGAAIRMPYFGNPSYQTFLYGVLMDAPSQIITAP